MGAVSISECRSILSVTPLSSIAEKVLSTDGVALDPCESMLVVLFCDLRGFSRISEEYQDDLMSLYKRIRDALGVMAGGIIDADGAIADFQGDAALGFWGWPIVDAAPGMSAVVSALSILKDFSNATAASKQQRFAGLSLGIGIATEIGLAGQIGTKHQAKIGVFGPIVNQGHALRGSQSYSDVKCASTSKPPSSSLGQKCCPISQFGSLPVCNRLAWKMSSMYSH